MVSQKQETVRTSGTLEEKRSLLIELLVLKRPVPAWLLRYAPSWYKEGDGGA